MMTYDMMIETIKNLHEDADYYVRNNEIHVTMNDFEGFDDEWEEIEREYNHLDEVNHFYDILENESLSHEDNYYEVYHFEEFDVVLGYSSMDI